MALRSLPSLRVWLQSTSLLAVVAGYTALFAFGSSLADAERLERHQRLVNQIRNGLSTGELSLPLPQGFGVQVALVPADSRDESPTLRLIDGSYWLASRSTLPSLASSNALLEVRQNITASIQSQRRDQLLLIAAAGMSLLLVSLLFRVVLWRGLITPLRSLADELSSLSADSLGQRTLDPDGQSQELQPIVEAFNQLQSRLAEAWQRERRFVDGVAHELRTPITVISGHAQSLQAELPEASPAKVALIAAEAERLGELVTVMLDLARSDAGRLTLELESLDPELVVLDAYERLQSLAPARLRLAPPFEAEMPRIKADAERLQQCLAALVDNALGYSVGTVQLAVSASDDSVTLHVRDQGPGIPEGERAQVLERFVRGSTSIGTRGSGIGLATVKLLMEAMQGELRIGDAPEAGADLQLRFKILAPPPAP
ncbi:HAMP domain-containing sensor histidine kinase [Synechococcus sp. PROS-U-1]|uniref:sensor histidine kinase n=1 Tax=Synechococcus sp. PROS-U-1 TaxID=1400866 RepID=UPI0016459B57|nr:HAMP domain-containing sensor histidine kinase [Synechococcus sp. PROS-U-1]